MSKLQLISPIDGSIYIERELHTKKDIDKALTAAVSAQKIWKNYTVKERKPYIEKFITALENLKDQISTELTWQMGRPISHTPFEVNGAIERTKGMLSLAEKSLSDVKVDEISGFDRFIKKDPVGVVFVVPAWNYPYLIAVNTVIPALLAGNAVILKHSAQTPLVAERFAEAFKIADLPEGLFQYLHLNHSETANVIRDKRINFVSFTGSVSGGHHIQKVAAESFVGVGLELGGKDPAYVRDDANLDFYVENLVEGAFFNSGQSCCGIERIYVKDNVFDRFVEAYTEQTKKYKLGNPLDKDTNLGPVAKRGGAEYVKFQIEAAIKKGAKALIDPSLFPETQMGYNYLAPQVLIDVDHSMEIMTEESFGPVVGIMKVKDDAEALALMNDSQYGLTASIWTNDQDKALSIGNEVETGTWFMNRCDYLDPYLAWTGVKDTGRGCTLSAIGYDQLTRPKSYHLRTKIK
ncbi:MAG: aldehyde dehydrogenase [Bacteroidetes bacterium]|nr:MAG: aldehyde dehydrogenase [Bacteroidota bacterium]